MPFDIFTAAAVRDELARVALGGRVEKIIQTSEFAVSVRVWRREWAGSIVLSADARYARIYATTAKLAKGLESPPAFLMLLRKYCTGSRITGVDQVYLDRILRLDMASSGHGVVTLIAELMGNRSNLILVDGDAAILGAIKLIGPRQSRTRRIAPHVRYEPPPAQPRSPAFGVGEKLDPLDPADRAAIRAALGQAPSHPPAVEVLVGLLRGCSPSIAGDVLRRAATVTGGAGTSGEDSRSVDAVMAAMSAQYRLLETRQWSPIVIRREGRLIDYRAYALPEVEGAEPSADMSSAIELVTSGIESMDALLSSRARLRKVIQARAGEIESRRVSLARGLKGASGADMLLESGKMILGFQHAIAPAQSSLHVAEMALTIALDPKLGPVENAERYFKRHRKAREAARRIPALVERAEADAQFVDELLTYVDIAETAADLSRIEAELRTRFGATPPAGKPKASGPGRILSVNLGSGMRILIGKSARQNEEVTFKLAGRSDLWLHARGVPGAHVVLQGGARSAGDQLSDAEREGVSIAASLAAYYSRARNETAADVIVARVKDVRHLPAGAPGQVTVRNEWTVRAHPSPIEPIEMES